jgi:AcrR family transcriptional regulator
VYDWFSKSSGVGEERKIGYKNGMSPPRNEDTRRRIVLTALDLFTRYGYKRTSVELLAAEAGVAKPTIYSYFDDKEAIFRAVVEAAGEAILAAAATARDGEGRLEDRLAAILSAKLTRYYELVEASPHAQELVDSQGRVGDDIVKRCDRSYAKLVTEVLAADDELQLARLSLTPSAAAQLLIRAASGASYDATSVASHRKQRKEIVRVIVHALRGR